MSESSSARTRILRRWSERLCWMVAAGAFVMGAHEARPVGVALDGRARSHAAPLVSSAQWPADSLVAWSDRVAAAPPFRLDRRPAVQYDDPLLHDAPPMLLPAPEPPSRPDLRLQGIVGRAGRWEAVLDGVPGREGGVLVRMGDTLPSGLRVQQVGADTVLVTASDTTWTLVVRRTWP